MIDLNSFFAGRLLCLDRTALPKLVMSAELRGSSGPDAGRARLARPQAEFFDDQGSGRDLGFTRYGSVGIVQLTGLITTSGFERWLFDGTTPDDVVRGLRAAIADPDVTTIVLLVDSPGGYADLVQETAAEVRRLREIKPITAIARCSMHSAAYWIASACKEVVATPSACVGSIGTFMLHMGVSRMLDQAGIDPTYIASDPQKVEMQPEVPLSSDAEAFWQSYIDAHNRVFVADVAIGRGISAATVRANFGNGRSFDAPEALRRGLIDRIVTLESLVASLSAGRVTRGRAAAVSSNALLHDDARREVDLDDVDAAIAIAERSTRAH